MKTLVLFFSALVIGLSSILSPIQARAGGYSGFTKENIPEFNDYINGLEMIKVQAGRELDQAIDAIPINLETAIDLEQERGLRDWLRQYLIAFSESGNDSLVAAFYLRAGFNKERYIDQSMGWADFARANVQNPSIAIKGPDGTTLTSKEEIEKVVKKFIDGVRARAETASQEGALPLFRSIYKNALSNDEEYLIENVSFHDSSFRVFELKKGDPTFLGLASDRGMVPMGYKHYPTELNGSIPALLEAGDKIICVDVFFIVEEPLTFTPDPAPKRTSSFFRLMWDQNEKLWRYLEAFYSPGEVGGAYFFNLL